MILSKGLTLQIPEVPSFANKQELVHLIKKVVNLTAHDITLVDEKGNKLVTFKPSGIVARVDNPMTKAIEPYEVAEGVTVYIPEQTYSINRPVVGLPDPQPNTIYLVSSLILQTVVRHDLRSPVMQTAIKDENGNMIGVQELRGYRLEETSEDLDLKEE